MALYEVTISKLVRQRVEFAYEAENEEDARAKAEATIRYYRENHGADYGTDVRIEKLVRKGGA